MQAKGNAKEKNPGFDMRGRGRVCVLGVREKDHGLQGEECYVSVMITTKIVPEKSTTN